MDRWVGTGLGDVVYCKQHTVIWPWERNSMGRSTGAFPFVTAVPRSLGFDMCKPLKGEERRRPGKRKKEGRKENESNKGAKNGKKKRDGGNERARVGA